MKNTEKAKTTTVVLGLLVLNMVLYAKTPIHLLMIAIVEAFVVAIYRKL